MATAGNKNINAKLVLLGDVGAGKSSLVLRFVKDQFVEFQESTIGAAFFSQTLAVNDATVKFEIWDTAGQERYHSLAPMYYRGAAAAIIVFDITNQASFERAKKWVQELQAQGNPNMVMALAGNKADLLDARKVSPENPNRSRTELSYNPNGADFDKSEKPKPDWIKPKPDWDPECPGLVLHQINEACLAAGLSEYTDDEIQPLAVRLALADAPEAFYISVKLGVEGIGEILRRSIAASLSGFSNSERLNQLLANITEKIDTIVASFTHLDKEFLHLRQITKSSKYMETIQELRNDISMSVNLAWATLHSLLHSERATNRQNGYIWLGDLLIAEISEESGGSIWLSRKDLQQKIASCGASDSLITSDIPVSVHLLCGLLKSKNSVIRWGFLFILERLLMRSKFLLDENETQRTTGGSASQDQKDTRLEKANAVIDIMSSALSLMAQINETDRLNILKMCDILFSQLCLKVLSADEEAVPSSSDRNNKFDTSHGKSYKESMDDADTRPRHNNVAVSTCETASMAAMLLRGQAIVPMQLVARVPAALFYWPLIQLAGAATDNIALGVAVGSKGRGNIPGATSDIRATLLLLLIGKCTADTVAFQEVGGEEFFRELLDDTDSRVAYYSSAFLLKRMMTEEPEKYQNMLQKLVFKAQQSNNEKLLENPYLQMCGILQLSNEL